MSVQQTFKKGFFLLAEPILQALHPKPTTCTLFPKSEPLRRYLDYSPNPEPLKHSILSCMEALGLVFSQVSIQGKAGFSLALGRRA